MRRVLKSTLPYAVNGSGVVAGTYIVLAAPAGGFVRAADGTLTMFTAPKASKHSYGTKAFSLNNAGEVAGTYYDGSSTAHGFIRRVDGSVETLNAPGAGKSNPKLRAGTFASSGSINAHGQVAGYLVDSTGAASGFLRVP
jgi:hypothetical protein